jgi:hypothetical protein
MIDTLNRNETGIIAAVETIVAALDVALLSGEDDEANRLHAALTDARGTLAERERRLLDLAWHLEHGFRLERAS